jgi:hypothetical protein
VIRQPVGCVLCVCLIISRDTIYDESNEKPLFVFARNCRLWSVTRTNHLVLVSNDSSSREATTSFIDSDKAIRLTDSSFCFKFMLEEYLTLYFRNNSETTKLGRKSQA